ncbi:MAG: MATE family efflux transporter [Anaerolineae bacterium]
MSQSALFDDRDFYPVLLQLVVPIALQQLAMSALNATDVLIVGQLGTTAVAAVGLANQILFLLHLFFFGVGSGAAIFSAQFWGRGDVKNVRSILGLALLVAVDGSVVFTLAAQLAPTFLLHLYSNDPAVIALGSGYLRLAALSYIPTGISAMFGIILRSTGHVRTPMAVSIGALGFKTALSYVLIFGLLGLPALGVNGAAYALTVARILECVVLLFLTYQHDLPAAARLRELVSIKRPLLTQFMRTSMPVIIGEIIWSLGITVYAGIYARISTESIAAYNIASTIEGVAFVPFIGLGNAAAILIGQRIGAGDLDAARRFAGRFVRLSVGGALLTGLLMALVARPVLGWYRISPQAQADALGILFVMSVVLAVKAGNMMMVVGVLRSGGDTRFALLADTGPMWTIGVPLALLGSFVLHLPIYWVVLMVMSEEVVKFAISLWRVLSGRWVNEVVKAL